MSVLSVRNAKILYKQSSQYSLEKGTCGLGNGETQSHDVMADRLAA